MGGWNLVRLAEALFPLIDDMDAVKSAIDDYQTSWTRASTAMMVGKLGLDVHRGAEDDKLWLDLTEVMARVETDMTLVFRCLAQVDGSGDPVDALNEAFYTEPDAATRSAWSTWLERYLERVQGVADRRKRMDAYNPGFILRNYLAQEAIELAEAGDLSRVDALLDAARDPYSAQAAAKFGGKRPEWARDKPGCSTLSCSS